MSPHRPQRHVSAPALPAGDEAFLDRTVEVFQPYASTPLTREDAREIAENVTGLLGVLVGIKRARAVRQHDPATSLDEQREAS